MIEQRAYLFPVIRGTADRGGRVIEACRIGLAKTVVELQGADDGGAAGDEGQQKGGQQAHGVSGDREWPPF